MPPITPFTYSVNKRGATIEHGIFAPVALDDGRCRGRRPLVYKTGGLHFFCSRCDREFDEAGKQRQNWAFKLMPDGNFSRDRPMPAEEVHARNAGIEAAGGIR